MSARNIIQQKYSCSYTQQRQLDGHILSPVRGVKAYAPRGGSGRLRKHRPFESCHSSMQVSENQGQRLELSILRPLARDHLNLGYSRARNSVARTRSDAQPSAAKEKAKERQ